MRDHTQSNTHKRHAVSLILECSPISSSLLLPRMSPEFAFVLWCAALFVVAWLVHSLSAYWTDVRSRRERWEKFEAHVQRTREQRAEEVGMRPNATPKTAAGGAAGELESIDGVAQELAAAAAASTAASNRRRNESNMHRRPAHAPSSTAADAAPIPPAATAAPPSAASADSRRSEVQDGFLIF